MYVKQRSSSRQVAGFLAATLLLSSLAIGSSTTPAVAVKTDVDADADVITNPTTYSDDFDNGETSGWTRVGTSSTWSAASGALVATSVTSGASTFVSGNDDWRNYQLTTTIRAEAGTVGVDFRRPDADNYYRFTMTSDGGRVLTKTVAGATTTLATAPAATPDDTTYAVKVVVVDTSLKVYVDDALIFDQVDASITSGSIGLTVDLAASGTPDPATASFDDVKVVATVDGDVKIAILPDTQGYTEHFPSFPRWVDYSAKFHEQTSWIAANRAEQNIVAVAHQGDVVGHMTCDDEWTVASAAMAHLDGKLPVAITTGNHDVIQYEQETAPREVFTDECDVIGTSVYRGSATFDSHFPVERYRDLGTVQGVYGSGAIEDGTMDSSFQTLEAGGMDLMLLTLPFGPSSDMIAWANAVVGNPAYADHTVIVVTHDYLADDDQLRGATCDPVDWTCADAALPGAPGGTPFPTGWNPHTGQMMFDALVEQNSNIRVVLSAHATQCLPAVPAPDYCRYTAGRRVHTRADGSSVFEMVADYQTLRPSGGEGYMRLLSFDKANDALTVSTFSPSASPAALSLDGSHVAANNFTLRGLRLGAYTDVGDTHPLGSWIYDARLQGLMNGYSDHTLRPGAPLNRQAAAAIIWRALMPAGTPSGPCDPSTPDVFTDVGWDHPFCQAIKGMSEAGRIAGYDDGSFRPMETISRQAFAAFLFRPSGPCPSDAPASFTDVAPDHVFCRSIQGAKDHHITTGYPDGGFQPISLLTRQAAAAMIVRFNALP